MEMALHLEQTYRKERGRLLAFIRSRIPDASQAEDLLQEVFLGAVRSLNAAQPVDNLLAWLYRAARNRIVDLYRRRRHTVSMEEEDEAGITLHEMIAASGITAEDELIRASVMESLVEALEELPAAQREVFIAQAVEGRSFRELAESSGASINTLLARKRYAVCSLRRRLAELKSLIECMS
jgi:RNA polymerase sigma factor (sigma-70 family)